MEKGRRTPIFVFQGDGMDPRVEDFRKQLHEDFDGSVLRTNLPVMKELPDRGPYGYAYIPLVENAVPTRQKPFRMQGEKLEAHRIVKKE